MGFFVHTSLIYYGLHTNPSFGAGLPDFKRTYLRPQEELENVLTIQIEPEFSALSVYEISRAIPALLPYQNNDFRGVNKNTPTLYPLKNCYIFGGRSLGFILFVCIQTSATQKGFCTIPLPVWSPLK